MREPYVFPIAESPFSSDVAPEVLRARIAEVGAERVVVGLPVSLGGGDSAQTVEVREFAARLARAVRVPVELYDERFTTSLALQAGGSASLDSRAAAVLLEEWLARAGTP